MIRVPASSASIIIPREQDCSRIIMNLTICRCHKLSLTHTWKVFFGRNPHSLHAWSETSATSHCMWHFSQDILALCSNYCKNSIIIEISVAFLNSDYLLASQLSFVFLKSPNFNLLVRRLIIILLVGIVIVGRLGNRSR